MADLAATNFCAVGRKYGVSDNAVRKWVRWYEAERERVAALGDGCRLRGWRGRRVGRRDETPIGTRETRVIDQASGVRVGVGGVAIAEPRRSIA